MSTGSEGKFDDDVNNGRNQAYLMSGEDNHVLLSVLYLDMEYLCRKIEDNLKSYDNS